MFFLTNLTFQIKVVGIKRERGKNIKKMRKKFFFAAIKQIMLGGSRDLNDAAMQQSCGDLLQTKYEIKRVVDEREKYISRK